MPGVGPRTLWGVFLIPFPSFTPSVSKCWTFSSNASACLKLHDPALAQTPMVIAPSNSKVSLPRLPAGSVPPSRLPPQLPSLVRNLPLLPLGTGLHMFASRFFAVWLKSISVLVVESKREEKNHELKFSVIHEGFGVKAYFIRPVVHY